MSLNRIILLPLLIAANLALIPELPLSIRVAGLFMVLLAPGILAAPLLFGDENRFELLALGVVLGFACCLVLFAAGALSGGLFPAAWWIVLSNLISVWLLIKVRDSGTSGSRADYALMIVLLLAGFLRFWNLGYSEFQGDETRALFFAAGLEQGDTALFFLHKKGPLEFLLPYGVLSALGSVDEFSARLPFALAGLTLVALVYVICSRIFSRPVALLAAVFCSIEGFILAFSRIVQYQSFLLLFAASAFYCALRADRSGSPRPWLYACAVFLSLALLCHYDASIAALGILALLSPRKVRSYLAPGLVLLLITAAFYVPFFLTDSFSNTASYLGQRIDLAKLPVNNLPRYFNVFSFYNSIYFTALVCISLLSLKWLRTPSPSLCSAPPRKGEEILLPERGAVTPCLTEGMSPQSNTAHSFTSRSILALFLWLISGLIAMGFLIARPNTHFYIVHVPLLILAACALTHGLKSTTGKWIAPFACLVLLLSLPYPWFAFLKSWPEFRTGYPRTLPAIYPALGRTEAPGGSFFGFPHLSGWKAVGALYEQGVLNGSYDSNEEELITAWYTRGAKRHTVNPQYYFIAASASDPVKISMSRVNAEYKLIGRIYIDKRKALDLFSQTPVEKPVPYQLDEVAAGFSHNVLPGPVPIRLALKLFRNDTPASQ